MADENNQEQNTPETTENTSEERRSQTLRDGTDSEKSVPYSRLQQEIKEKREYKQRVEQMEAQQEQEAEERAKKRGEYETVANRAKAQAEKEKNLRIAAENRLVRYQRLQTWREAARGIVRDEALEDAFDMLDEDELGSLDETDVSGMSRLAEILVDRKEYLGEGPRGAGSGFGSREPVLQRTVSSRDSRPNSPNGGSGSGIKKIIKKRSRRQWK
jgi:hypothetical protein